MAALVIRVRDLYFWPDDLITQAGQRAVYHVALSRLDFQYIIPLEQFCRDYNLRV